MILLEMKIPQLSKPEATAARNENSIGDRMEKKNCDDLLWSVLIWFVMICADLFWFVLICDASPGLSFWTGSDKGLVSR